MNGTRSLADYPEVTASREEGNIMTREIKIAIVGIGNCASSLIQGLEYYRHHDSSEAAGLIHPELG